jgi:arabinofuranan 3-O-arabinosyltransferase
MRLPDFISTDRPRAAWVRLDAELVRTIARTWVVLAGAFCVYDLFRKATVGLTDGDGRPIGDDFINYWSGAFLALHQRAAEIYHWPAYHAFQEQLVGAAVSPNYNYSYPPVMLILGIPFALLPYVPALAAWLIGGWLGFYHSLRLAMPGRNALLLALAAPAVFINTYSGQNGVWTAALLGGGLCLLERRPFIAGVLFGLQAYKPHLALMIPVALLAGRQWRALAAAGVTAGALVLASLALVGWETWRDYLGFVPVLRRVTLEDAEGMWHRHASVFMAVNRMGAGVTAAYAAQAVAALIAAALVALAWFKDAPAPARNAAVVIGALLATPYLQDYDLVVGAFAVAWLTAPESISKIGAKPAWAASALLLVLPLFAGSLGKLSGLAFGPLFVLPALVLTAKMIVEHLRVPVPRIAPPMPG